MSLLPKELGREIVLALRLLYWRGLISGASGNISARLGKRDAMVITPSGLHKATVSLGDLVVVSFDGEVLAGDRPSIEWRMHREVYLAREDIRAVVHAHPPFTLAAADAVAKSPYPEVRYVVGRVSVVPPLEPGSVELAARVGAEFRAGADAVIMLRHGVVIGGTRPLHAEARVEALEEVAKVMWLERKLLTGSSL